MVEKLHLVQLNLLRNRWERKMIFPDWLKQLEEGKTPEDIDILMRITAGKDGLANPFISHYLDRFILGDNGVFGSKVKFLVSNEGSGGKTHFLKYIISKALKHNYKAVYLCAGDFKISYINQFYTAIMKNLDLDAILTGYRNNVIRKLGYKPEEIDDLTTFIQFVEKKGEAPAVIRRDLRVELSRLLHNSRMDRNFALALIQLTYGDLEYGRSWKEPEIRQCLLDWFYANPDLYLSQLKKLNLYVKINRQNARRMLCSLAEMVRLAGFAGLIVCLDELDDLLAPKLEGRGNKYTKTAREDTYESIRELIDDQEMMQGVLFMFAGRRSIIDDEAKGLKVYPALWMRIREEIIPKEAFNPYTDLIDLDRFWFFQNKEEVVSGLSCNMLDLIKEVNPNVEFRNPDADTLNSVLEITPFNIRQAVRILSAHIRRQFH